MYDLHFEPCKKLLSDRHGIHIASDITDPATGWKALRTILEHEKRQPRLPNLDDADDAERLDQEHASEEPVVSMSLSSLSHRERMALLADGNDPFSAKAAMPLMLSMSNAAASQLAINKGKPKGKRAGLLSSPPADEGDGSALSLMLSMAANHLDE